MVYKIQWQTSLQLLDVVSCPVGISLLYCSLASLYSFKGQHIETAGVLPPNIVASHFCLVYMGWSNLLSRLATSRAPICQASSHLCPLGCCTSAPNFTQPSTPLCYFKIARLGLLWAINTLPSTKRAQHFIVDYAPRMESSPPWKFLQMESTS